MSAGGGGVKGRSHRRGGGVQDTRGDLEGGGGRGDGQGLLGR